MALGQMTYAEQSKLTLDFMLAGIELSMILFSVFMGISLFQREVTLGSISMVLSKPVNRSTFLFGKFLGQITVASVVTLAMGIFTGLVCSRFEGMGVSLLAIFQSTIMIFFEIAVLTAMTYFFAVNAGAVTTAVVTLCLFGLGHLQNTISENLKAQDAGPRFVFNLLQNLIPNLEVFNMKSMASYGNAIPWSDLGWAGIYCISCVLFFLALAAITFNRKDILT
jgi:ABC-type transport system involved in multi-copper enzyme maturation permease subunit